ncbi:bifunctional 4-hydroxy-2-oxoglutarate aldolase/2-dehydro-3-deoxy-phosphogluconate aldolase [Microbacterium trichothecenolyticum]
MNDPHTFDAFFESLLQEQPIMGVFRNLSPAEAVIRATRAWDAGVRNVEIPVQTADAMPTLTAVIHAARERGLSVGAGTIITTEQLDAVERAGVAYTVSPGWDQAIVIASLSRGLPHLPGVATASEILCARRHGLRWVKAFPGSVLGAAWISAMRGPFPDQRFVVTGGMTIDLVSEFLNAGAQAVAVGAAFSSDQATEELARLIRAADNTD